MRGIEGSRIGISYSAALSYRFESSGSYSSGISAVFRSDQAVDDNINVGGTDHRVNSWGLYYDGSLHLVRAISVHWSAGGGMAKGLGLLSAHPAVLLSAGITGHLTENISFFSEGALVTMFYGLGPARLLVRFGVECSLPL